MNNNKTGPGSSGGAGSEGTFAWMADLTPAQWKIFGVTFSAWTFAAMNILLFTFAAVSIAEVFSLSPKTVGWLFSVMLFSTALGGILFGVVSDYLGRVKAIMLTIFFYSFFSGLSAFSPNILFLVVCIVLLGLGMGGQWASGKVLVAETWPREHRGAAIGMVQSGWSVGYLLITLLAALILPRFDIEVGWRVLFLVGAVPLLLIFYVWRNIDEPEIWRKTSQMRKEKKLGEGQEFTLSQIFHGRLLRYTVLSTILTSFCMIAYWGLMFWVPLFLARPAEEGGVGLGMKGFIWLVPLNIGAFLGHNSFGWISDKLGRRPVFAAFLVGLGILTYFFGNSTTLTQVLIFGPLVGFFGAGFYSGFGSIFAELFPTRTRATAQGFCYNMGRGISAIAPPIIGYLAGIKGYGPALVTVSIFAFAAAIVVFALPETKGKELDI